MLWTHAGRVFPTAGLAELASWYFSPFGFPGPTTYLHLPNPCRTTRHVGPNLATFLEFSLNQYFRGNFLQCFKEALPTETKEGIPLEAQWSGRSSAGGVGSIPGWGGPRIPTCLAAKK